MIPTIGGFFVWAFRTDTHPAAAAMVVVTGGMLFVGWLITVFALGRAGYPWAAAAVFFAPIAVTWWIMWLMYVWSLSDQYAQQRNDKE